MLCSVLEEPPVRPRVVREDGQCVGGGRVVGDLAVGEQCDIPTGDPWSRPGWAELTSGLVHQHRWVGWG